MSVYLIHEKKKPIKEGYICSSPSRETAVDCMRVFEDMDLLEKKYVPDRYEILKREYCPTMNEKCATYRNGICLREDPGASCPEFAAKESEIWKTSGK